MFAADMTNMTKVETLNESDETWKLDDKETTVASVVGEVMEVENYNKIPTVFEELWVPSKNLMFTTEQDGYCYYEDSTNGKQYTIDGAGVWYVWNEAQCSFVAVEQPSAAIAGEQPSEQEQLNALTAVEQSDDVFPPKRKREAVGIAFDEDGFPIFPTNAKGQPVLPIDDNEQPFFPVDQDQQFVFPYDRAAKKWTFPVDNTEEPIFPRNMFNKPIVPLDSEGHPIFPVDERGEFVFPLDESHCPIPALTPTGRPVIPRDEFGEFVIPRDREGRPLIHMGADGVTPLSLADYRQWKQSCRESVKLVATDLSQQPTLGGPSMMHTNFGMAPSSIFHPLNLQQYDAGVTNDIAMLQRSRRVRPEDIDLPMVVTNTIAFDSNVVNSTVTYSSSSVTASTVNDENSGAQPTTAEEEEERAQKRKKLLSAQLHFSKRIPLIVQQKKSDDVKESNNGVQAEAKVRQATAIDRMNGGVAKPSIVSVKTEDEKDLYETTKSSKKEKKRKNGRCSPSTERWSSRTKRKHRRTRKSRDRDDSRTPSDRGDYDELKMERSEGAASDCDSQSTYSDGGRCNRGSSPVERHHGRRYSDSRMGRRDKKPRSTDGHDNSAEDFESFFRQKRRVRTDDSDTEDGGGSPKRCRPNLSSFDVDQLNEYSDLDVVKRFIKHSRRRYGDIKNRITELEKTKAQEKSLLKKLYEIEAKVESRLGMEYILSPDER